jgi:hypothetical protein
MEMLILFTVLKANIGCSSSFAQNSTNEMKNAFKNIINKIKLKENILKYDQAPWNDFLLAVTKHIFLNISQVYLFLYII